MALFEAKNGAIQRNKFIKSKKVYNRKFISQEKGLFLNIPSFILFWWTHAIGEAMGSAADEKHSCASVPSNMGKLLLFEKGNGVVSILREKNHQAASPCVISHHWITL